MKIERFCTHCKRKDGCELLAASNLLLSELADDFEEAKMGNCNRFDPDFPLCERCKFTEQCYVLRSKNVYAIISCNCWEDLGVYR
jgi:hypothetical protein